MIVKLISAELNTKPIHIIGKPDKRFKSGWRVKPDLYVGYELKLRLSNPEICFRVHEIVITQFGKFMVTLINNVAGYMELTQCVAVERAPDKFAFNSEMEVLSCGFTVREGLLSSKLSEITPISYKKFTDKYPNI